MPLWAQVLADLRVRLDADEFVDRFPTDKELIDQYDVSRHTVRDAVRRLHEAGVLDRERGRGTFVRSAAIEQPLGALYSMFRSIEDQGFEQRSKVRVQEERIDAAAAAVLEVEPSTPLLYLERVRFADRRPVAFDCSWLPGRVAAPLLEVDFTHTALYRELAGRCGVTLRSGWERIRPAVPTPEQRRLLEVPSRSAVFLIERLATDGTTPMEWRHSVVRGDLVAFVARWSGGDEHLSTGLETWS